MLKMVTVHSKPTHSATVPKLKFRSPFKPMAGLGDEARPGEALSSEFSKFLLQNDLRDLPRRPSHLLPPTTVVQSQLDALQRNDWPDIDGGVETAFEFTMQHPENVTSRPNDRRCRSWFAQEGWFTLKEFSEMLHGNPYAFLIDFDTWKVHFCTFDDRLALFSRLQK